MHGSCEHTDTPWDAGDVYVLDKSVCPIAAAQWARSEDDAEDSTFHNGAAYIFDADRNQQVLQFDATKQAYIAAPNGAAWDTNTFTISFWMRPSTDIESAQGLVAHGESFDTDIAHHMISLLAGKISVWTEGVDDADYVVTSMKTLTPEQWTHIAVIKDVDKTTKIIIDGTLDSVHPDTGNSGSIPDHPLTIGCRTNTGDVYQDFYSGRLDDVLFFDSALTLAQATHCLAYDPSEETGGCDNGWTLLHSGWIPSYAAQVGPSVHAMGQVVTADNVQIAYQQVYLDCQSESGGVQRVATLNALQTTEHPGDVAVTGETYFAGDVGAPRPGDFSWDGGWNEEHSFGGGKRFIIRHDDVHCAQTAESVGGEVDNPRNGKYGRVWVRQGTTEATEDTLPTCR
jgi:hypothetical protein